MTFGLAILSADRSHQPNRYICSDRCVEQGLVRSYLVFALVAEVDKVAVEEGSFLGMTGPSTGCSWKLQRDPVLSMKLLFVSRPSGCVNGLKSPGLTFVCQQKK